MNRQLLAALSLVALLGLAGCSTVFGPGEVSDSDLAADPGPEYDWDRDRDAYLEVYRSNYTAVYRVGNRTTGNLERPYSMELYDRDTLGTEQPVSVSAVQFRYANGSTLRYLQQDGEANLVMLRDGERIDVDDDTLVVNRTRRRTQVYLPTNESGKLAFTAPKNGKGLSTPTFVAGSYEMRLPDDAQVGLPVLSQVQPSRSSTDRVGDRVHVRWEEVTRASSLVVRYYLGRDLLLFGGLVALVAVLGGAGAGYYWLGIRETVRKREEVGLDVDTGDDDGPGGGGGGGPFG
jgi:hypothetical protein